MISEIVKVLILVIGSVLTTYVVPYLKAKVGEYKYNELERFIKTAVQAMKQYYIDVPANNTTKKARVTAMAKEYMRDTLKFELTDAQLDLLIEGIYNGIKEGMAKD